MWSSSGTCSAMACPPTYGSATRVAGRSSRKIKEAGNGTVRPHSFQVYTVSRVMFSFEPSNLLWCSLSDGCLANL